MPSFECSFRLFCRPLAIVQEFHFVSVNLTAEFS
jgi:hypothetical protein